MGMEHRGAALRQCRLASLRRTTRDALRGQVIHRHTGQHGQRQTDARQQDHREQDTAHKHMAGTSEHRGHGQASGDSTILVEQQHVDDEEHGKAPTNAAVMPSRVCRHSNCSHERAADEEVEDIGPHEIEYLQLHAGRSLRRTLLELPLR